MKIKSEQTGEVKEYKDYEELAKDLMSMLNMVEVKERIKVESSNLEYVSYNQEKQELTVYFKNRKAEEHYIYSKVPVTVFGELMQAESKGKYFQKSIRNVFQVEKIE